MIKVAIIGIVGVPANYGGFETLAENLIRNKYSEEIEYTVFCSAKSYKKQLKEYRSAKLRYIYLKANGIQSTLYDIFSMLRISNKYDAVLILGVSGCIFLPILRFYFHNKIIVNIDGLEHKREKWNSCARWFLKESEAIAVRNADYIIADNIGIQKYVKDTYHKYSVYIAYGGDHAIRKIPIEKQMEILRRYGMEGKQYAISVCRIEPENNCHLILEAFSRIKKNIVFIGNWEKSEYGKKLKDRYNVYSNITICSPEYDLDVLFTLRKNAALYIHGHSAGGTNPSLVEAMSLGCNIIAYDVVYNRETTLHQALFFSNVSDLVRLLEKKIANGEIMKKIAESGYCWKSIVKKYESLFY